MERRSPFLLLYSFTFLSTPCSSGSSGSSGSSCSSCCGPFPPRPAFPLLINRRHRNWHPLVVRSEKWLAIWHQFSRSISFNDSRSLSSLLLHDFDVFFGAHLMSSILDPPVLPALLDLFSLDPSLPPVAVLCSGNGISPLDPPLCISCGCNGICCAPGPTSGEAKEFAFGGCS